MQTPKSNRRVLLVLCMISIMSTLTGCWDNRDINHRVLPVAIGISKQGNEYKVILKIQLHDNETTKLKIVTQTGETISKAVDNISTNMESSVDLLHVKIIVIDKKTAEDGVKDIISGFMRSREVSPKALIAICDEDIENFFTNIKKTMTPDGTSLFENFDKGAGWNPQIALTRIWEVYRSVHSYTHDVAIPIIISGKSTNIEHIGSAIIKNGKMVERINNDETLLFNAFKGESTHGQIEVMTNASVLIIGNSMNIKSKMKGKQPFMEGKVNLKVVILETRGDPTRNFIKKELNAHLSKRFSHMFEKIQKSEADILALGQYFRTYIPRSELKSWRNVYYPNLKMDIQFQIDIQNEGYLKTL
jgi:spore germination protein KC